MEKKYSRLEKTRSLLTKKKKFLQKAQDEYNQAKEQIIITEKNELYKLYKKSKLDFKEFCNMIYELIIEEPQPEPESETEPKEETKNVEVSELN